ncbi:MAG: hypothetical protein ACKOWE_04700 [Micrococcales bacterium]
MPKSSNKVGVKTYLSLSAVAALVVGLFVWGGVRDLEKALLWGGISFIVILVSIATLALSVKNDDSDPDKPRLK